jgi:hypothetical protein
LRKPDINQQSVVITLAVLLALFSFAPGQPAQDAFSKLAFGALTALAAFIQLQK